MHVVPEIDEGYTQEQLDFYINRQRLYSEYNAQRMEPSLYDVIQTPRHVSSPPGLFNMGRFQLESRDRVRLQEACVSFEHVLPAFRNLASFEATLADFTEGDSFRWRN